MGVYVELLEYHLLPVLKCVPDTLRDPIFQQNNVPVCKATVDMDFFQKYTIQVENWPPYSPDLNPMEPLWVEFMYRLHRKYPDIRNPKRGLHKVEARLAEVPA